VRGAVVDDHEHALGLAVGLDRHELLNERVERDDPVGRGAAIEQLRAPGIPGGEVAQRVLAFVLVLDALAAPDRGCGGQRGVLASPRLDRGLLITADDVVAGMQQFAFPAATVEVEDTAGLDGELGIAGEDPGAVLPRPDRVFGEPAPDRHPGDLLADSARYRLVRAQTRTSAPAAPRWRRAARTPSGLLQRAPLGGNVGGLPRLGRSSRPARRCSKKRFRHCETTSRPYRTCAAI